MRPSKLLLLLAWLPISSLLPALSFAQLSDADLAPIRDAVRETLDPARAGAFYAATTSLTVNPDLSVANIRLDSLEDDGAIDPRVDNYRIPLRFALGASGDRFRPFVQTTIGYQDLSVTFPVFEGSDETIRSDWRSRGIDVGAGVEWALNDNWSLQPVINLGVANLNNKADYRGVFSETILRPAFEGIVFDWDTNAWLAGVGIAARYQHRFERFQLLGRVSGQSTYIRSFDESSPDISISDSASTLDLEINTIHPMGSIAQTPWSLVSILGASTFVGEARGELGFDYFLEAGAALQFDLTQRGLPVDDLRIGMKVFGGADVSGWSLIVGRGI